MRTRGSWFPYLEQALFGYFRRHEIMLIYAYSLFFTVLCQGVVIVALLVVLASAADFHDGVSTALILSYFFFIVYTLLAIRWYRRNLKRTLRVYLSGSVLIGLYATFQVAMWMGNPYNLYYEPRSVFLVSMSAIVAFGRSRVLSAVAYFEKREEQRKAEQANAVPPAAPPSQNPDGV